MRTAAAKGTPVNAQYVERGEALLVEMRELQAQLSALPSGEEAERRALTARLTSAQRQLRWYRSRMYPANKGNIAHQKLSQQRVQRSVS